MATKGQWEWDPITSLPETAVIPVTINSTTTPVSKRILASDFRKSQLATPYASVVHVPPSGGAAVADATDAPSVILRLNELLARLRVSGGNGMIADS